MAVLEPAMPHTRLLAPKSIKERMKPQRRPKMLVSFPLISCVVVSATRYVKPSHDMMANKWNSNAIVKDNVEVMVLSDNCQRPAEIGI